jgi:hypothetical protein
MQRWRSLIIIILLVGWVMGVRAQEPLRLPAALYVLSNEGIVQRYRPGDAGLKAITPLNTFVLDFRLAPDDNWLAYRTLEGLWLTNLYRDDSQRLIEAESAGLPPIRGRGDTIAWTSQADALAYTTVTGIRAHFFETNTFADITIENIAHLSWSPDGRYLAAESSEDAWWIYQREGGGFRLTSVIPATEGAAWVSLTEIVFAPPEGGLVVMDLGLGNAQTVLLDPAFHYRLPFVESEEALLAFMMTDNSSRGRLTRVFVNPQGAAAVAIGEADVDVTNLRWSPQGNVLVGFQGGAVAVVNALSGEGVTLPLPVAAAYSWGAVPPSEVALFPLPSDLFALAPDEQGTPQVWRIPRDLLPYVITQADVPVTSYALNIPQDTLAYLAGASLWVQDLTGDDEAVAVTKLTPPLAASLAFGPDGLLYYRDTREGKSGIWRIDPKTEGPTPDLFIEDSAERLYFMPRPSSGTSALAVGWSETGAGSGISVYNTTTRERLVDLLLTTQTSTPNQPASLAAYRVPQWLEGTQMLFGGTIARGGIGTVGLHVLDINNTQEPPFVVWRIEKALTIHDLVFLPDEKVARVLTQSTTPGPVSMVDVPLEGGAPTVRAQVGFLTLPRLSPDGSTIAALTQPGGDIVVWTLTTRRRVLLANPGQVETLSWR